MERYKKQIETVDDYIKAFPRDVALKLESIREAVRKSAPKAQETISYYMPAFKLHGMLLYFAAFSRHIGFYPLTSAIKEFRKELSNYKTAKGSIQFPLNRPVPLSLIKKIVKFRVHENMEKVKDKKERKKTHPAC